MSSYYIGEDDSFTNINESFASAGTNSLASTSKNGDICGQYFLYSTTAKGSTTNIIYHLLSHHGIVKPKTADKEISKCGLEGKFTAITTDDDDSNMVSGSSLLKESLNIERISCAAHTLQLCIKKQQQRLNEDYPEKLRPIYDVATCWSSTYNSWVRLAPPLPPSPSTNSSFIVSTSSIVHTSSTISSSHALISPSPPLFNEDVDSSSAVNNNESNYILYLVDVFLLSLDICICIYLKSI
ncbi:6336_t:CDS:2 [Entrophospora sp. SA101]|nr:6336_t:CDS:2 [Entrophospora sp. SA101]